MTNQQPVVTTSRGRQFACSPAAGSEYRWFTVDELRAEREQILVPDGKDELWLFERAIQLFRLYRGQELPLIPHRSGGRN